MISTGDGTFVQSSPNEAARDAVRLRLSEVDGQLLSEIHLRDEYLSFSEYYQKRVDALTAEKIALTAFLEINKANE